MRSNQPIADILLWDCDNHLEKEGGKGLVRRGQGNTKTYLKQLFEDINGCSEYGRGMVNDLRDEMLNREIWRNTIREVSIAQKNKQLNSLTTIIILQQIQIQPQQPKGEEDRQERELHRVTIFHQFKALPSEELGSRIFKSGIIYKSLFNDTIKNILH